MNRPLPEWDRTTQPINHTPIKQIIIAVALQLAGAELLIWNYWSKPIKQLKSEEMDEENHVKGSVIIINSKSEDEIGKNILLNRFAFVMIAFVYVAGIFGDLKDCCRFYVALCVIILSVLFAYIAEKVTKKEKLMISANERDIDEY